MASTSIIGSTTGGSDIKIIHMSTNRTAGKETLWFDGGLHARYVEFAVLSINIISHIFNVLF